MMSAAGTIKRIRISLYLDQDGFADAIGTTKQTVSNYERGIRHPKIKTIKKIKELAEENNIDVNIEDFFD